MDGPVADADADCGGATAMGEDEEEEEDGGGLRAPTKGETAAEWCGDGVGGRELRLALACLFCVCVFLA